MLRHWKTVLCVIVILILSSIPKISLEPLEIPFWKVIYLDKQVHFLMYFGLSFMLTSSFKKEKIKFSVLLAVICSILYGGAMELLQGTDFVNRKSDWLDFAANSLGAITTLFLYPFLLILPLLSS